MAKEQTPPAWGITQFRFKVKIGNKGELVFQEVSWLEAEDNAIEYRGEKLKLPGLNKFSSVTLKRGLTKDFWKLQDFFGVLQGGPVSRVAVSIQLQDETGNSIASWTLSNAYPLKLRKFIIDNDPNEVAIEELLLGFETMTIGNG